MRWVGVTTRAQEVTRDVANAVGIPNTDILGVPLAKLDVEQFSLPITAYTRSYFLTARLAARHMSPNKSGVIMTVTALPAQTGTQWNEGYGPALAAKEALTRVYPSSSHLKAFAWSVCDHTVCRRQERWVVWLTSASVTKALRRARALVSNTRTYYSLVPNKKNTREGPN
jgi:hypothetical protein